METLRPQLVAAVCHARPMEVGEQIVGPPVVEIEREGEVRELPPGGVAPDTIAELGVETAQWGPTTVAEILARHDARSLVVVHRGVLAYEWYGDGGAPERRQRCYSLTKSFTGTLAATAVGGGQLDRSGLVTDLLPELAGTGFAGATVGDVADMTVSIGYDEDYTEAGDAPTEAPTFGFGDYMIALGLELPGEVIPPDAPRSIRELLTRMPAGPAAHGYAFAYATPVTDVLAWLLERATDQTYPALLQAGVWARIGAERNAGLSLDPTGTAVAGGGLAVTTRDLARFGLFLLEQSSPGADAVVAPSVIEVIRDGGDEAAFQRGGQYDYLMGYSYRDQWWMPGGTSRPLSAWGIHGQLLWIDPVAELVVATHGGSPHPTLDRRDLEQDALCRALTAASREWDGGGPQPGD